ncbi:MAG: hypothetical protein C1943_01325 [Halochromatium sp.]|nr:hypothetical protein [Halochromatium sp.]
MLERQFRKRFGPLDADTEARLRSASSAEIEHWAERIFDARQLADVFTDEEPGPVAIRESQDYAAVTGRR